MKKFICLDIGGTYIKYGVLTEDMKFLTKGKVSTKKENTNILENISSIIKNCKRDHSISGIAISSAGIVDSDKGKIISATLIDGYSGLELKKELEYEFDLKCEVENDVNCVGIAENYLGEAKDAKSCVCITVGTGIGGCVLIDNNVINGFTNSAGELGYMYVNNNRFSQVATASSLVKNVSRLKAKEMTGEEIFQLAKDGDSLCIIEIDKILENLATGIANIIYILNPEVIVLGGGIMEQEMYIKERLNYFLKEKVVRDIFNNTTIKFAKNQNDSGILGALINFLQKNKKY